MNKSVEDRIRAKSDIAKLFNPDMKADEDLADAINTRISYASPLLDAAIRGARDGRDRDGKFCPCCHDNVDLLEAYKAIVRLTRGAAELEKMRRGKTA